MPRSLSADGGDVPAAAGALCRDTAIGSAGDDAGNAAAGGDASRLLERRAIGGDETGDSSAAHSCASLHLVRSRYSRDDEGDDAGDVDADTATDRGAAAASIAAVDTDTAGDAAGVDTRRAGVLLPLLLLLPGRADCVVGSCCDTRSRKLGRNVRAERPAGASSLGSAGGCEGDVLMPLDSALAPSAAASVGGGGDDDETCDGDSLTAARCRGTTGVASSLLPPVCAPSRSTASTALDAMRSVLPFAFSPLVASVRLRDRVRSMLSGGINVIGARTRTLTNTDTVARRQGIACSSCRRFVRTCD
jgi:hypothetical protein